LLWDTTTHFCDDLLPNTKFEIRQEIQKKADGSTLSPSGSTVSPRGSKFSPIVSP